MADPEPIELALWGLPQAGKTAFLAQLFQQPADANWQVWPLVTARNQSQRFFTDTQEATLQNRFLLATSRGTAQSLACRLQRADGLTVVLNVEDRPGFDWQASNDDQPNADRDQPGEDAPSERRADRALPRAAREVLEKAAGVIVLLHPTAHPKELESEVHRTFFDLYVLRDHQRDPRPVAVCLSKADSLIRTAQQLREAIEDPERFVLQRFSGGELERVVRKYCENPAFFPVSSVGVRLRYGVVEPMTVRDVRLTLRKGVGGTPINLLAPFDWIIRKLQEPA